MALFNRLIIFVAILFILQNIISIFPVDAQESPLPSKPITHTTKTEKNYREGEVIVEYRNKEKLEQKIEEINDGEAKKNSAKIEKHIAGKKIALLKSENKKTEDLIADLEKDDNIETVEPNYLREFSFVPDDEFFDPYQWAHLNTGQTVAGTTGTVDADADILEAWDIEESGATQTIVAVIDSGVLYSHPDISANMWDGTTCVDEDNLSISGGCPNHGWDFENNDNDPDDESGHGTHIASIIGATTDNSVGIAGMSRYNNLKVMALRFDMDVYTEVDAINFAKNNGAKVINGSFSGTGYSSIEKNAIDNFNGIFVAAAGNGGGDEVGDDNSLTPQYPCNYSSDNVICVAASDQNDQLADFSNYSASGVDLAAPGVLIAGIGNYPDIDSEYVLGDGTSFAAPLVAGTVGLLYAHNPTASTSTIRDSLLKSSDHLESFSGKTVCSRRLNTNTAISSIINETIPSETCVPPVYRFWSNKLGSHFYTANEAEKDRVIEIYDDETWKYEGVAFYTYLTQEAETSPVYRFWSNKLGSHFYTANEAEKDRVIEIYDEETWKYEGVAFYTHLNF
jgi:subtilisin family serine protease